MSHSRHHEKSHRILNALRSQLRHYSFVVVDSDLRGNAGIRPPIDEQKLSTTGEELPKVRIDGIDWCNIRPVGKSNVAVEVDGTRFVVPLRVSQDEVLEELYRYAERLLAAGKLSPTHLAARIHRRVDFLPGSRVDGTRVNLACGFDLSGSEAV